MVRKSPAGGPPSVDRRQPSAFDNRHAEALSLELDRADSDIAARRATRAYHLGLTAMAIGCVGTAVSVWGSLGALFPVVAFASLAVVAILPVLSHVFGWRWAWLPIGVRGKRTAPTLPRERALEMLPATHLVDLVQPLGDPTLPEFPVAPVGGDLYVIARIPAPMETESFGYRDIVALESMPDGTHVLRGVEARSGWVRYDAALAGTFIVSEELAAFQAEIVAHGGLWMRYSGGCLAVAMPPGSDWDFEDGLDQATTRSKLSP